MPEQQCLCGSGIRLIECCGAIISGLRPAATAEELMRSRYTANVLRKCRYLLASWHESTRPDCLDSTTIPHWVRLEVVGVQNGASSDDRGVVEFKAIYKTGERFSVLHERSRFVRQAGKWVYLDGDILMHREIHSETPGRNALCPCGSGRKYKKCCLQSKESGGAP